MRNFVSILFLSLIFSCGKTNEQSFTKIEFEDFKLTFDNTVNVAQKNSMVILNEADTLFYNKGIGINRLIEKEPKITYLPPMQDKEREAVQLRKFDSAGIIVVRNKSYDLDRYKNQNVTYKNIGGKRIKIVFPRLEEGITGIYIDSLGKGSSGDVYGEMKVNLYGKNLSKESRESFLNAVNTIKFNIE